MSDPSLDFQKALRARLVASSAVTSLVPAAAILDRNARPVLDPSIIIGEGQTVPDDGLSRNRHITYADLHIWKTEAGLAGVKQIAGAIRDALADGFWSFDHFHVADMQIAGTRFLRDPDGLHSHGIVSLQARVVEAAS